MEVHREAVKLKEVFRLRSFYVLLNKGKSVLTSRENKSWEVVRKYMGELMKDKDLFSEICPCRLILDQLSISSDKSCCPLPAT